LKLLIHISSDYNEKQKNCNQTKIILTQRRRERKENQIYFYGSLDIGFVIGYRLPARRTNLVIPEIRGAAVSAAPALILLDQPGLDPHRLNTLHIIHHRQPIGVLGVIDEMDHFFAGADLWALDAEFVAFISRAVLNGTIGTVSRRSITLAAVTGLLSRAGFGFKHHRTCATIESAITVEFEVHKLLISLTRYYSIKIFLVYITLFSHILCFWWFNNRPNHQIHHHYHGQ
jgi:hypothetical protein